jgi:hypothetical protein
VQVAERTPSSLLWCGLDWLTALLRPNLLAGPWLRHKLSLHDPLNPDMNRGIHSARTNIQPRGARQTIYAGRITPLDQQIRVALLVDYPVLMRTDRTVAAEVVPRLGDIVLAARDLGTVFISRAYGAWYDIDEATVAFSEGLDPCLCSHSVRATCRPRTR